MITDAIIVAESNCVDFRKHGRYEFSENTQQNNSPERTQ